MTDLIMITKLMHNLGLVVMGLFLNWEKSSEEIKSDPHRS